MNEFKIEPGEKFALVFVSSLYKTEGLKEQIEIDKNIWFLPNVPIQNIEPWQRWIGTLTVEKLRKSNFCLLIKLPSTKPEILDSENETLMEYITGLFYCIIFQGIPIVDNIYFLSGANVDGEINIRRYSGPMHDIYYAEQSTPVIVTLNALKQAIIMNKVYLNIFHTEVTFRRLRDGFHSLIRAIHEANSAFRIHDYVRSLEAIVKPRYGTTKADFVYRCQTLAKACPETPKILKDIYNLRSANEHLNDWLIPISGSVHKATERLWQTENLVLRSYTKLLSNPILLQCFQTDDDIDAFWKLLDHERREIWNNPLDLRNFTWTTNSYGRAELTR